MVLIFVEELWVTSLGFDIALSETVGSLKAQIQTATGTPIGMNSTNRNMNTTSHTLNIKPCNVSSIFLTPSYASCSLNMIKFQSSGTRTHSQAVASPRRQYCFFRRPLLRGPQTPPSLVPVFLRPVISSFVSLVGIL